MAIKRWLKDYFTMNRRETRGVVVLLFLLIIVVCAKLILWVSTPDYPSFSQAELERLQRLQLAIGQPENQHKKKSSADTNGHAPGIDWRQFDPNTASVADLISLGLPEKRAQQIHKFSNAGGRFEKPEDLYSIYYIDSNWVKKALPYVQISEKENERSDAKSDFEKSETWNETATKKKTPLKLELNEADSAELIKIKGVGPYFASEIIRMRQAYGGIRAYEQLLSIYHMNDRTMDAIANNTTLDTTRVTKVLLNSVGVDALASFPMISWKQAAVIVNYREQHGAFAKRSDLLKTKVITDSLLQELIPYISLQ